MAKKKTPYSKWYRKIRKNKQEKRQAQEAAILKQLDAENSRIERENAKRQKEYNALKTERQNAYAKRKVNKVSSEQGLERDFKLGDDLDDLFVKEKQISTAKINETRKEERKRLKELAKIEKQKKKALAAVVKNESEYMKNQSTIADEDEQARINADFAILNAMRASEDESVKALRNRERIRNKENKTQYKENREIRKEEAKLREIEYEKNERIRKEERRNQEKIEERRRKATGYTTKRRVQDKLRRFFKIYSFQNLKDTVNTYGYSYSFNEFIKQAIAIVAVVTIIAWYSSLRGAYLGFVIVAAVLSVPWLLYSWFNQMFANKKFEMVQTYLSNILPIFMQKPKIRYALAEVEDMEQGQMQSAIHHAIDYIDTSINDGDIMKTALSFIETEFPNSRIKAVHKLLLDVESGNSKDYTDICENMYTDVEAWIRRVYGFQKELKSRRNSLIILCGFSLVLNTVFTVMYSSSEIFDGFTDRALYQWSTMIFILLTLITIALILTQMHGSWLVYDSSEKQEEENTRAYEYIHNNEPTMKKKDAIPAIAFAIIGAFMILIMQRPREGACVLLISAIFFSRGKMVWNAKYRKVSKTLMLEFPVWLRGVALNLHEMTVVNAIQESQKSCSYCMSKEIDKFFEIYNENPTSIRAFNEFLQEYKIEDVQASMKVLFTIQSMSGDEIQKQVAMIINRNQELLTKTETIRNQDALGMAELLGYAPMVLLTVQLLVSMLLMFMHIMEYMDNIMTTGLSG